MRRKNLRLKNILCLLMAFLLAVSTGVPVMAEEGEGYEEDYGEDSGEEEETEYIPEEYYDPIESNDLKDWPQGQAVQAASAVVMDLDTNALLYSKNAYEKMYPASITKIMTAMLALEKGNLEEEIEFSEIVYDIESDSSHAGIQPGEKMDLRDALEGLMLESANDIANGLAEHFCGSLSAFADEMNAKAEELGCVNTHFTNPHGLHNENHYTCAYDMALIAQAAYKIPEFRELASDTLYTCSETNLTEEKRYFVNHHKMIQQESDYYADWCTGGKTGFTSDAWNTLVTYGEKNGMRLVCVLLHENGAGRAYLETTDLMNYGFDQFEQIKPDEGKRYPTFYEAMKLNYLGLVEELFQADALKRSTMEIAKAGLVTLPRGMGAEKLSGKVTNVENTTADISYLYEEWPVGSEELTVTLPEWDSPLCFEKKLDMQAMAAPTSSRKALNEIETTALTVMENTKDVFQKILDSSSRFIEENTLLVVCIGSLLLLVLVIFIIILICRCTRESRLLRRRRQEEKERLRIEEEIEKKTTEEIEIELRAAMEQEQQRRQREAARKEEERIQEEKLHETERILEEINRKE
ncbi:MAG: D-alanyl-D-alanine carboxypeptidase family protein [Lachnospiraceae bacterium]|nr:D-alanyl-D-alanine carboxypeptidase family protein [Lachnospiraceae bacterium]